MTAPLLAVDGLTTVFATRRGTVTAVDDVSLEVAAGEIVGLIGESGSGKTITGLSILRLLPDAARIAAGRICFDGRDLLAASASEMRALRGRRIAMIFQDPTGAFNPVKSIRWHLGWVVRRARGTPLRPARVPERILDDEGVRLLGEVGIPEPLRVLPLFPHQLSGGMLQRVLVAMVLGLEPALIIADEPTTNLDALVEAQILELFRGLRATLDAAFIFVTHDMSVVAQLCDRVVVMYAGKVVESAPVRELFDRPQHPYTQGLMATSFDLDARRPRLAQIAGELPDLDHLPPGCRFAPRCPHARPACERPPPVVSLGAGHTVRCVLREVGPGSAG